MRVGRTATVLATIACAAVAASAVSATAGSAAGSPPDTTEVTESTEVTASTEVTETTEAPATTEVTDTTEVTEAAGEGVVAITGSVAYSDPFFTMGTSEPLVILEDQSGFIARDRDYVFPVESQVIGAITSDFLTSPFTYSISLPAEPQGPAHDVDNDGEDEAGVQVYAVAYWTNTWGDTHLEERDQGGGGWSSAYASTVVSTDPDSLFEVVGGKLVVWAPDDAQEFPTGFGPDGRLFTDDDLVGPLPAGWSVIDLDQSPFGIDRTPEPTVDLLEPVDSSLDDFSALSYTEAFDAMVELFRTEYAFTELKGIDWDAKAAEFRPAFEAAEEAGDPHAYALALRDFLWSIPDVHVGFDQSLLDSDFATETAGGLGLGLAETDDGEVIVVFLTPGGPAEAAGIQLGATISAIGGQLIADAVDATVPWSSPFSNPEAERQQQLRYVTRFPLATGTVDVAFTNPGETKAAKVTLDVVDERDSFAATSLYAGAPPVSLPVEFTLLPSGLGHIRITDFADDQLLTIALWERAIRFLNDNEIPGVVIDMRLNGGGSGWLADQMAAYFFAERMIAGETSYYSEATGEFYQDPDGAEEMIPPPPDLQYHGEVAVIVGPGCVSACEFFSYALTIDDRAVVVGEHPSAGGGGSIKAFLMPEGIFAQLTVGRATDPAGEIHIEGSGIEPTVDVPVTAESLLAQAAGEDVVLAAAEAELLARVGG